MQITQLISYMDKIFAKSLAEYIKTDSAYKTVDGVEEYQPHILDGLTLDDKLFSLDLALKEVVIKTKPLSLIETVGSTATVFKRISLTEFIRLPNTPTENGTLDVDDGLAYAVMFKALSIIWNGYSKYSGDADTIVNIYNDATRDYFLKRQTEVVSNVLFRFSSDNVNFHDNYMDGDIYISFKSGTGDWSVGVRFVGQDGADGADGDAGAGSGGGATTFVELTDTPNTLTEGKFLAVGANNTVVEVDAPTSTGGTQLQPFDGISGVTGYTLKNFNEIVGNYFYVEASGSLNFGITQTNGAYDIELGKPYIIQFIPNGNEITLNFNALGDKTIDSSKSIVFIELLFDSIDIYIMSNKSF